MDREHQIQSQCFHLRRAIEGLINNIDIEISRSTPYNYMVTMVTSTGPSVLCCHRNSRTESLCKPATRPVFFASNGLFKKEKAALEALYSMA
jgi:hypothetical protein